MHNPLVMCYIWGLHYLRFYIIIVFFLVGIFTGFTNIVRLQSYHWRVLSSRACIQGVHIRGTFIDKKVTLTSMNDSYAIMTHFLHTYKAHFAYCLHTRLSDFQSRSGESNLLSETWTGQRHMHYMQRLQFHRMYTPYSTYSIWYPLTKLYISFFFQATGQFMSFLHVTQ